MTIKWIISCIVLFFWSLKVEAQDKKIMTPEVYSQWNTLKNQQMSEDGQIITFELSKEIGDKTLTIYVDSTCKRVTFERVGQTSLVPSGKWVVFTKKLATDSLNHLKRKKTAKDLFPLDTLVLYSTVTHETLNIPEVLNYKVPEEYSEYLFYSKKHKKIASDSIDKNIKKNTSIDEYTVVRHLNSGKEDTLFQTKDYVLARDSAHLLYTSSFGDSTSFLSVFYKRLNSDTTYLLADSLVEVKNLSLSNAGDKVAFLGLRNKVKKEIKPYKLFYKTLQDSLIKVLDSRDLLQNNLFEISDYKPLSWSESGKRLFFGIAPVRLELDTTLLDDEIVDVEIWHYDTPRHYPQLNASLEKDKKKTYGVMYDFENKTLLQYEDAEKDKSQLSQEGDGEYILQLRTQPHQKAIVWAGEILNDIFILDTKTGESQLISLGESGQPLFSPEGKYVYWWSRPDSIWKALDVNTKIINYVGLWNYSKFHNELHDLPMGAEPYGIAGWLKGDTSILVYDRYDLWELKPNNPFYFEKLTDGRKNKDVYRWINWDDEKNILDPDSLWFLHKFNEKTKAEAYLYFKMKDTLRPDLFKGDFWLSRKPKKSKTNDKFLFTKENFSVFPDLLLADGAFQNVVQVSDANPHQNEYGWGHAEVFSWRNYNRETNDGLVFFPPNFDPEKKYPLIVNFYERSSDGLNRHRAPMAHRSTINYTYYTNNDYIVFNPDIRYTTGQPGEDCFTAVESGVEALLKLGYIDSDRIALQGHSWGGYQIAYLLTKTDRYKCAESGAPVVNMVSAYGGIRWETGLSRMFQYEKTQSRLGVTLWENPGVYHKNSPIYNMDKVTTPVLIMHNDNDGHVPWYQGIEYFMALRRLNKPAWLLNYKGEPHWPLKWQNRLDFNIRMQEFFDHYLKDSPMPNWMKEGGSPLEPVVRKRE